MQHMPIVEPWDHLLKNISRKRIAKIARLKTGHSMLKGQKTKLTLNLRPISLTGTGHWNSKLSANITCKKNNQSVFVIF